MVTEQRLSEEERTFHEVVELKCFKSGFSHSRTH